VSFGLTTSMRGMRIPRILLLLLLLNLTTNFLFFSYYALFFILLLLYPMLDNLTKINFGKGYPNFYMLVSPVAWQSKL
jgi:hypothetical protein